MTRETYLPSPWFRFDYVAFDRMTAGLKANEIGILLKLLVHFHKHGEPTHNDAARLARVCGTSKPAFDRAIELFLASGILVQYGDKIWSQYIEDEIAHRTKISVQARKNSSVKREKVERNQSGDLTGDDKSNRDIEGETLKGSPQISNISNLIDITKLDDIAPSRASDDASGARSRYPYKVGDRLQFLNEGLGVVIKVGMRPQIGNLFICVRLDETGELAIASITSCGALAAVVARPSDAAWHSAMQIIEWEKRDAA
ncbi:YdaU family protein [Brucella anthropi]|uniref:YdaU family protein n=1 Tax=Brucella anthropi TaxID=529 RepID=UPI00178C6EC2|nr:YdaU family protein [Brucella anthropi]